MHFCGQMKQTVKKNMLYGVPYTGSKNAIAEWIVEQLPAGKVLVDLFAGGCAVTHAALLSGKWEHVIANDINDTPSFFKDCVEGKYAVDDHLEWISREEFQARKDTDPYVRLCWSFGNKGNDYIYGADIEELNRLKHAMLCAPTVKERRIAMQSMFRQLHRDGLLLAYDASGGKPCCPALEKNAGKPRSLQRLPSLPSLQRLQNLQCLQRLQSLQSIADGDGRAPSLLSILRKDYAEVELPEGAVVYCDIPYCTPALKRLYNGIGFDYVRFYLWALDTTLAGYPVYISEYHLPSPLFRKVAEIKKLCQLGSTGSKSCNESLWVVNTDS